MQLPEGFNIHHPDYMRRDYNRNSVLRTVRQLGALSTQVDAHNDLHANLPPIPRMSLDLAKFSIKVMAGARLESSGIEVFEERLRAYDNLSRTRGGIASEAGRFAEHFEQQYEYLRGNTL